LWGGIYAIVIGLIYLAVLWVLEYRPIGERPLLIYSAVFVLAGVQLACFGILAELMISLNIQTAATYSIAERLEPSSPSEDPR
jgi:hypothetical protein